MYSSIKGLTIKNRFYKGSFLVARADLLTKAVVSSAPSSRRGCLKSSSSLFPAKRPSPAPPAPPPPDLQSYKKKTNKKKTKKTHRFCLFQSRTFLSGVLQVRFGMTVIQTSADILESVHPYCIWFHVTLHSFMQVQL